MRLFRERLTLIQRLPIQILSYLEYGYENGWQNLRSVSLGTYGHIYQITQGMYLKQFGDKMLMDRETEGEHAEYDYIILHELINSPHYVKVIGWIEKEFMIMEQAEGISLDHFCKKGRELPDFVLPLLKEAFQHAIEKDWVPLDISPRHVFVEEKKKKITLIDTGKYLRINQYRNELYNHWYDPEIDDAKTNEDLIQDAIDEFLREWNLESRYYAQLQFEKMAGGL